METVDTVFYLMIKPKENSLIAKYKKLSVQTRASIWFVLCNFILKALNFLNAPVFTRLLSTDQYGIVATFTTYQQIMLILATFELPIGAFARGYIKYENSINQFTTSIIILSNIITTIFFFICLVFMNQFMEYTSLGLNVLMITILFFWLQPAYNCWMVKNRFEYRYLNVVIATITFAALSFILPIVGVFLFKPSAEVKIIATLISAIISYFPFYFKTLDYRSFIADLRESIRMWKYALEFQTPLVLHSISFLILGQSDRVMISRMVNSSSAAIYSVAYTMGSIAIVLQTSINQAFQPYRYKCLNEKKYEHINNTTIKISVLLLGSILLFVLVAPELFRLLFPSSYSEALVLIPPIAASVYFMFMYSVFVDIESFYEKTKYVMYASIICAMLNIVLNYEGIIHIGYYACGYTTLISYFVFSVMHYFFMKKVSKEEHIGKNIFNTKFIVISESAALIIGFTTIFLYKSLFFRYALVVAIFIITVYFKDVLIKVFNEAKHKNE